MGGAVRLITAGGPPPSQGTYQAGLEIRTDAGWKTYWRFPGDSGIGTSADFSGSANVASTTLDFPAPERHEDPYSTTIGYVGGIVLPIMVTPQATDRPATLVADVTLGFCKDVCVPVSAHLEIPLAPEIAPDDKSARAIAEARSSVPRPARPGDPLSVTDVVLEAADEPAIHLTVHLSTPDAPADLFVEGPEGSYLTVPTLASREGATALFTLPTEGLMHEGGTTALRLTLVNGDHAADQPWTLDTSELE